MTFQPDVNKGNSSPDDDVRLGPSTNSEPLETEKLGADSIKDKSPFGLVYRRENEWRSRVWHNIVNRQAQSDSHTSPVYREGAIEPGTKQSLLLKSQADEIYSTSDARGASSALTLEVDASNGDVTEDLPFGNPGDQLVVVRVDDTSNTATIRDQSNNNIIWPGRVNSTTFDLHGYQSILMSSDGTNWYVENPAVYEIGSFAPGGVSKGRIMLRHKLEHDLKFVALSIDTETAPNNPPVTFNLYVGSGSSFGSPFDTVDLSGNTKDYTSLSKSVTKGDVIKVESDESDSGLADVSMTFDALRD